MWSTNLLNVNLGPFFSVYFLNKFFIRIYSLHRVGIHSDNSNKTYIVRYLHCPHYLSLSATWSISFFMLYHLSHTASPFCSDYCGDGISKTICPGWCWTMPLLISASQIGRITDISHWFFVFVFWGGFFGDTRVWTQGLTLARQGLYHLSHSASPFSLVILEIGSHFLPRLAWTTILFYISLHN
jgi:hypothetical protein